MSEPKTPNDVVEHLFCEALRSCEMLAAHVKHAKQRLDGPEGYVLRTPIRDLDTALRETLERIAAFRGWVDTVRRARREPSMEELEAADRYAMMQPISNHEQAARTDTLMQRYPTMSKHE